MHLLLLVVLAYDQRLVVVGNEAIDPRRPEGILFDIRLPGVYKIHLLLPH